MPKKDKYAKNKTHCIINYHVGANELFSPRGSHPATKNTWLHVDFQQRLMIRSTKGILRVYKTMDAFKIEYRNNFWL